jgi:hypothetical protein
MKEHYDVEADGEWWSAAMQLMGEPLWCYVEIRAANEDSARLRLKRLFRDCVNINYVERTQ